MRIRLEPMLLALTLLSASPLFGQAQSAGTPVVIPTGTTVDAITLGDDQKKLVLKPEEQVAFLFVYDIWNLERDCVDKQSGLGRLCSAGDLVKGLKGKNGHIIGLTANPSQDANYRYGITIIGEDCIITASPKTPGFGGFAAIGTPDNDRSDFYFNPAGPNMAAAQRVYSMGYEGNGFKRTETAAIPAPQPTGLFGLSAGGTPEAVQAAIAKGEDVNALDPVYGATPLQGAAWKNGNVAVIDALLKAGADINAKSNDGATALMIAALYNPNPEVILELLKAGADPKVKNTDGKTAFDYAQTRADLKGTDALTKLEAGSK